MSLYAIGDLHLSLTTNKPMDVFGPAWENHVERLLQGFSCLTADDVTVLCGDLSWGMKLPETLEDFRFIDALPGRKIILKGNHDYWWETVTKTGEFFAQNGINTIEILNNNFFPYGENAAVCGTRGWFFEEETGSNHDRKILNRELGRLETSLKAAGDREKYVFLHYPPKFGDYECPEILALLQEYGVVMCCSGHIHGKGTKNAFRGRVGKTQFELVSADYLGFVPRLIIQ